MTPTSDTWQRAIKLLTEARTAGTVVVAGHVDPDGDALGSAVALHRALSRAGWDTVLTWGNDPLVAPQLLREVLDLSDAVAPSHLPEDPAILIALDTASPSRLGALAPLIDGRCPVLVVDHHVANTTFGNVRLVDGEAAATAVVVDELIRRLGLPLDPEVATALYVALVTDTGGFQLGNTNPAALQLAARLVSSGADAAELSRRLFASSPLDYLRVLARVLGRVRLEPGTPTLVWSTLTLEDLDAVGLGLEEAEGIIGTLRTAEEADVVLLAKQLDADQWSVSLRSRDGIDVGSVAQELSGGGHRSAAGFTTTGSVDDVVATVLRLLRG